MCQFVVWANYKMIFLLKYEYLLNLTAFFPCLLRFLKTDLRCLCPSFLFRNLCFFIFFFPRVLTPFSLFFWIWSSDWSTVTMNSAGVRDIESQRTETNIPIHIMLTTKVRFQLNTWRIVFNDHFVQDNLLFLHTSC